MESSSAVANLLLAWRIVEREASAIGLTLNHSKCELFSSVATSSSEAFALFPPSVKRLPPDGFSLLGAPVGRPDLCAHFLSQKIGAIREGLDKLKVIGDPQVELALLRSCLGLPKFAFALRTSPPDAARPSARAFDDLMDEVAESRLGLSFSPHSNPPVVPAHRPRG
jgi:hypothetical protein